LNTTKYSGKINSKQVFITLWMRWIINSKIRN
jgi:hypothetical protein